MSSSLLADLCLLESEERLECATDTSINADMSENDDESLDRTRLRADYAGMALHDKLRHSLSVIAACFERYQCVLIERWWRWMRLTSTVDSSTWL